MNSISTLFCTYDRASESYSPPFAAPHSGVAIRGFTDAINAANGSDLAKHPDDFDLFEIGYFDSNTGYVTPHESGRQLVVQGKQIALQLSSQS
ncbi:MAG: nonstructural protein [Arizlama microvirus]|nr:MAG: nonstructural protein [Arizlama microvirus]